MNTFIIKKSVIVEPQYLDENLSTYLDKKVKEDFVGKCFKEYGYIVDVVEILDSKSRITKSDSINIFDLEFKICSLLPKVGNKYKTVTFVNAFFFENPKTREKFKGSLWNLYETEKNDTKYFIQIFVTNGDKTSNMLTFSDCECTINCDNQDSSFEIDVVVDSVSFKDGQFRIIGKHVH